MDRYYDSGEETSTNLNILVNQSIIGHTILESPPPAQTTS